MELQNIKSWSLCLGVFFLLQSKPFWESETKEQTPQGIDYFEQARHDSVQRNDNKK